MALTKKMLLAMDISDEKADQIIDAHKESINGLTAARDTYKEAAEKLPVVEKQLTEVTKELETLKSGDWEKKYEELKSEYATYKTDIETKAVKATKEAAYRKLLEEAGVLTNSIDAVLKVSNLDSVSLDEEGKIKDADKLIENVKTEWAGFIPTVEDKGVEVPNPPANNGGGIKKPSRAAEMVAKYRNEHYGNPIKED